MKTPRLQSIALVALATMGASAVSVSAKDSPKDPLVARAAQVDQLVAKRLADEGIEPNAPASDEVFVRRVYLDIAGRIPSIRETRQFLASKEADKRRQLIDELLASPAYVENFYNYWADILRMKSTMVGGNQSLPAGLAYAKFIKESLADNKPYDQLVRELLTAEGKTYENGAVGFYIRDYNMQLDNMAVTTQVFLGTQMVCAQCHDHPFDKWSQMDYYQMAAHTYGVRATNNARQLDSGAYTMGMTMMGGGKKSKSKMAAAQKEARIELSKAMTEILRPLRYNYVVTTDRALRLPHDYAYDDAKPKSVVEPTIPVSFAPDGNIAKDGENPVVAYADWMTSPNNPRFTLVIANRLWKKAMGMGVIEPVDELTDSTVPSNPALMTYLEGLMKELNYDMKEYLRVIFNSETYQRSAYTKDVQLGEVFHFPGPVVRRMSAEQIWDSMNTLIKPNPDAISRDARMETDNLLTRIRWMDQALNALTDEELAEGARQIADLQKELSAGVRKAQEDLEKATEAKDEKAIRAAKKIVSSQRSTINDAVQDIVFQMGYAKFQDLAKSGKLKEQGDPILAKEIESVLKSKNGAKLTFDQALAAVQKERKARLAKAEEAQRDKMRVVYQVTKANAREFSRYAYYSDNVAIRAADVRSPAPLGHFLREFGQSDRELIENANPDATVGQALMMLNGNYFAELTNPFTVISRAMDRAESTEDVIDTLYIALLSRHATDEEKKLLTPVIESNPKTGKAEALWTLLNTRQFLFNL